MDLHLAFLAIGGLFLLGVAADALGRRTRVPRVTLLILLGVALGDSGLQLMPPELAEWHEFLATAALTLVAFALGGELTASALREHGREIVILSLTVVLISTGAVIAGLLLMGAPLALALILGGVSTATDPAATRDVANAAPGRNGFIARLLGIVAIDDAWGLIIFGLLLAAAKSTTGDGVATALPLIAKELGGAALVGVAVGAPAAYLTGRLCPGEPTRIEILGVVFLCAGLAVWMDVSFLLAGMIAGVIVANFAQHHDRPFHEIENVQGPFLILFFLLAGATFQAPSLGALGAVTAGFVALRVAGRIAGGWIGGRLAGLSTRESLWTGAALTPQAGVALGMALVAGDYFPELRETMLSVAVATTILFEVLGPLLTQRAIAAVEKGR